MDFFATAAKGTEGALRDELRELGLPGVKADRGGVHFQGALEHGWRACLYSRIAVRVLAWRAGFECPDGDALYEGIRAIDWRPFLTPDHTLSVKADCRSSHLTHSQFVAQRTKDAIVDQLRDRYGARPSVELTDPDVRVVVHLVEDRADVYLDLAGEALHRRGYRARIGEAPLKETLAAAIVRLSGWDRVRPFLDPMCGSGSLVIEASAWARNVPPGLARPRFGFERWALFDESMRLRMSELRAEARAGIRSEGPDVFGRDNVQLQLDLARANAADAKVPVHLERGDIEDVVPLSPPGFMVTNPPYGERLEGDSALYRTMGRVLTRLHGHTISVLAGTPAIAHAIPLRPTRWLALFNGPIECRLLTFVVP